jgi:hypothetical protein
VYPSYKAKPRGKQDLTILFPEEAEWIVFKNMILRGYVV